MSSVKKLSGLRKRKLAMEIQQATQRSSVFNGYEFKLKHVSMFYFLPYSFAQRQVYSEKRVGFNLCLEFTKQGRWRVMRTNE